MLVSSLVWAYDLLGLSGEGLAGSSCVVFGKMASQVPTDALKMLGKVILSSDRAKSTPQIALRSQYSKLLWLV